MFRVPLGFRYLTTVAALLPALLATVPAQAQAVGSEPAPLEITHGVELRGGYTGGRYSHSTDDFHSSLSIFNGGGNARTGSAVEHRFDGLMLGADYVIGQHRPGRPTTTTLRVGLDVLGAADRLRIGDGRRATLNLLAAHPHFSIDVQRNRWQTRVGVGVLAGRVSYYAQEGSFDLLSTNITVDMVHAVATFQLEMNWNHWFQYEVGYDSNGLLGMVNPVSYGGVGTGFGPRSTLALVVGVSSTASLEYQSPVSSFAYSRVVLAPTGRPWQASAFITYGSELYQRTALQGGYKLPTKSSTGR
ncbi:hypothetical protein [Hymenobacter siberiensis]|uniref:hypothetical protein n=1 Tax=Hymenobacter siberiensis TaxID=2848396 RepID=UPI001C1E1CAB|nr:hypothetical protein [Hymenobacter siberiensis]